MRSRRFRETAPATNPPSLRTSGRRGGSASRRLARRCMSAWLARTCAKTSGEFARRSERRSDANCGVVQHDVLEPNLAAEQASKAELEPHRRSLHPRGAARADRNVGELEIGGRQRPQRDRPRDLDGRPETHGERARDHFMPRGPIDKRRRDERHRERRHQRDGDKSEKVSQRAERAD